MAFNIMDDIINTDIDDFQMGVNYALARVRKEPLLWCYVGDWENDDYGLEIERPTYDKAWDTAYIKFSQWYAENGSSFISCVTFYRYYQHPSGRMAIVKKIDTVIELDR